MKIFIEAQGDTDEVMNFVSYIKKHYNDIRLITAAEKIEARPYELISGTLIKLGIKPNQIGCRLLITAAAKLIEDERLYDRAITKLLYPALGEIYNMAPHRIERNIRSAIERGWASGEPPFQRLVFGYDNKNAEKRRPNNSAFIRGVANYILYSAKKNKGGD